MRYLKSTIDKGLICSGKLSEIIGFCDADWASDIDSRRSTTGYVFIHQWAAISWATRRQRTIALSSIGLLSCLHKRLWCYGTRLLIGYGICFRSLAEIVYHNEHISVSCIADRKRAYYVHWYPLERCARVILLQLTSTSSYWTFSCNALGTDCYPASF